MIRKGCRCAVPDGLVRRLFAQYCAGGVRKAHLEPDSLLKSNVLLPGEIGWAGESCFAEHWFALVHQNLDRFEFCPTIAQPVEACDVLLTDGELRGGFFHETESLLQVRIQLTLAECCEVCKKLRAGLGVYFRDPRDGFRMAWTNPEGVLRRMGIEVLKISLAENQEYRHIKRKREIYFPGKHTVIINTSHSDWRENEKYLLNHAIAHILLRHKVCLISWKCEIRKKHPEYDKLNQRQEAEAQFGGVLLSGETSCMCGFWPKANSNAEKCDCGQRSVFRRFVTMLLSSLGLLEI